MQPREAYRGGFNFASRQALLAGARIFDQLPEVGQNKAEVAVQKIAARSRASLEATNKLLLEQDVNFYSHTIIWCKHRVRR